MSVYAAVVHKEPGTHYGVTFPDLDGCFTSAASLERAMIEAEEALALYLEGLRENGEAIPEPRSLEAVQHQIRNQGVHALFLVEAPEGPAKKVLISLPADLLQRVDSFAKRDGYTRSGFLARAAKVFMRGEGSAAKV